MKNVNNDSTLVFSRSLSFYKLPRVEIMDKRYSITLNKEVDLFQINDEISKALIMFYHFLVYTITNHILLSNTFSPKDDFFCVQTLIHMTDIRKNTSNDSSSELINGFMVMLQEENQKIIKRESTSSPCSRTCRKSICPCGWPGRPRI
jgi:hypothetical protein